MPRLPLIIVVFCSLAGNAVAQPPKCWEPAAIGAARISEVQIMLMGASIRCNTKGFDIRESYRRFLVAHRKAIDAAEAGLKLHFGIAEGARRHNAFDNYQIALANHYGGGRTDEATCKQFGIVAGLLGDQEGNSDLLATVAMQLVRDPRIDGPRCPPRTH